MGYKEDRELGIREWEYHSLIYYIIFDSNCVDEINKIIPNLSEYEVWHDSSLNCTYLEVKTLSVHRDVGSKLFRQIHNKIHKSCPEKIYFDFDKINNSPDKYSKIKNIYKHKDHEYFDHKYYDSYEKFEYEFELMLEEFKIIKNNLPIEFDNNFINIIKQNEFLSSKIINKIWKNEWLRYSFYENYLPFN